MSELSVNGTNRVRFELSTLSTLVLTTHSSVTVIHFACVISCGTKSQSAVCDRLFQVVSDQTAAELFAAHVLSDNRRAALRRTVCQVSFATAAVNRLLNLVLRRTFLNLHAML